MSAHMGLSVRWCARECVRVCTKIGRRMTKTVLSYGFSWFRKNLISSIICLTGGQVWCQAQMVYEGQIVAPLRRLSDNFFSRTGLTQPMNHWFCAKIKLCKSTWAVIIDLDAKIVAIPVFHSPANFCTPLPIHIHSRTLLHLSALTAARCHSLLHVLMH